MNGFSEHDILYMRRCLQLARCGNGSTSPNPMVGAVIVYEGRIIGEGYHVRAGEPHAEVNAVNSVKGSDLHLLPSSTIYVSLEPCSHYGKTPPCCDLIIAKGMKRVVIATTDFNVQVNGGGIERMRAAGIDVEVGLLQGESFRLNEAFFKFHQENRPFVTLKWAQSADGFVDRLREGGEALRISTPLSALAVHRLRALYDAIMVGRRTALLDNPSLDIRHWTGRRPLRLVVDRAGKLPFSLKLFSDGFPTTVFVSPENRLHYPGNVERVELDFGMDIVPQVLSYLSSRKLNSLLVEGGPQLLQSFLDYGSWDVARVEVNGAVKVGSGVPAPLLPVYSAVEKTTLGGNEITLFRR